MKNSIIALLTFMTLGSCKSVLTMDWDQSFDSTESLLLSVTESFQLDSIQLTIKEKGQTGLHYQLTSGDLIPQGAHNQFAIGSATKLFTSVVIMQLVEEGSLSLNDKVTDYIAEADQWETLEIKHCLSNTSGIQDIFRFFDLSIRIGGFTGNKEISLEEVMERIKSTRLRFDPGSRFEYSSSNFVILGAIAEEVYQKPLYQILEERIFTPLAMDNTVFYHSLEQEGIHLIAGVDHNYLPFGKRDFTVEQIGWYNLISGGGAILSTSEDMAIWMEALFNGELISSETLNEMMDFRTDVDRLENVMTGYGLGLSRFNIGGETWYGHAGGMMGYQSLPFHNPESGRTMILQFNESKNPGDYYYEIFQRINSFNPIY